MGLSKTQDDLLLQKPDFIDTLINHAIMKCSSSLRIFVLLLTFTRTQRLGEFLFSNKHHVFILKHHYCEKVL